MYYIALVHREGKHWLAEFPDAPGCQTFADSEQELAVAAQEALEGWLEAHLVDGKAPPRPAANNNHHPVGRTALTVHVSPSLSAALHIRWKRQELGLSQRDLAARLGVSQQQVAKLENPDENPTLRSLEDAAKSLGLAVDLSFAPAAVG